MLLFQFLELLQVAFLELLQDITKVYSVRWKKRLTKPSFVVVGVTRRDAVVQVDRGGPSKEDGDVVPESCPDVVC